MLGLGSKAKQLLLLAAFLATPTTNGQNTDEAVIASLPNCGDNEIPHAELSKRLLYVSTLDGKVSALDITKNGEVKWTVETGSPLLSSSIHKLDLTSNGKWVRLIPSLSGGLYKFDGENIEAIPIKAEDLLRSSFKFSDDIVMSGGMETRSYGISAKNGKILYECSISGCKNYTHSTEPIEPKEEELFNPLLDDVIILKRETQTVRAIEPREGIERWNFSIGIHQMEILKSKDCQGKSGASTIDTLLEDLEFKAIVPEGIVCAFSKKNPNQILWMHQFEFPIVSAWKSDKQDSIEHVDFFSGADWLWNSNSGPKSVLSPSLYLGMYDKQPYIQESDSRKQLAVVQSTSPTKIISDDTNFMKIPFKPFPATREALEMIEDHSNESKKTNEEDEPKNPTALANSVLYASEYVNGNGFYFYTQDDWNKSAKAICDSEDHSIEATEEDISYLKIALNIMYKWKEAFILICTSMVFVLFFLNKGPSEKEYVVVEKHVEVPVPFAREAFEGVDYSKSQNSSGSNGSGYNTEVPYQSRFVGDYDVLQVLGKGGFGVVFAAKNKVDDCHYAIKRIILPNRQESRERVMREVKTLAHCDHQNIVRYFSSWVETPPEHWQEEHDKQLQNRQLLSTSIDIGTPTEVSPVSIALTSEPSNYPNYQKNTIFNRFNINSSSQYEGGGDGGGDYEDSSSHIVFADESQANADDVESKDGKFDENKDESDSSGIVFMDESHSVDPSGKDVVVSINHEQEQLTNRKALRPTSLSLSNKTKDMILSATPPPPPPVTKTYLYIQMQLCQKVSLKDWLSQKGFAERHPRVVTIFEQIVGAVEYCHLKGLIHRDLKPSNIFFALDGQIKIGDFGLVTDMAEDPNPCEASTSSQPSIHTKRVGTHLYMSPEQCAGLPYNYKVDIYSLGLILFELYMPFGTEMERIQTLKNLRLNKFPDDFKEKFQAEYQLLELMLSENPAKRPTTFGIRARPPLKHEMAQNDEWHFELPPRPRRESTRISVSA